MDLRRVSGGLALAAVMLAGSAHAAALEWTLQDVVLSDGAAVAGTFNYDADNNVYSNVNITVAAGPDYATPTELTVPIPVNGAAFTASWFEATEGSYAGDATGLKQLFLVFAGGLTDEGGKVTIAKDYGSPQFSVCGDPKCITNSTAFPEVDGGVNQGFVTTEAVAGGVPEPGAWALMLLGFGGFGVTLRVRRRAVA